MSERTPEEELEFRRHVHRLARRKARRRKVMIARAITGVVCVILLILIMGLIRFGVGAVHHLVGGEKSSHPTQTEAAVSPTLEPLDYTIPEGMEAYATQLESLRSDYPVVENILLNMYQYTNPLLELVIHNQETLDFVTDYPRHKTDDKATGTISQDELAEGIPSLEQWDKRWGYVAYGNDIIAIDGCGPTCLSMVCAGLLQDTTKTPDAIADFSMENNYYATDSGTSWTLMSNGASNLGLKVHSMDVSAKSIRKQLKKGRPVICSMRPGDFTTQGHFIVLTGITEDGKLTLNDPNNISRSKQQWDMDTVVRQIKALWAYSAA